MDMELSKEESEIVMGDSPEKKTIRFNSVSNSIRFDSIQYSQSAHILARAGRPHYC